MIDKFGGVWLALTYDCQNKCKWCYASADLNAYRGRNLPEGKISPTLDLLQKLGVRKTTLIGGEPTLYKNLSILLEEHLKRDIKTGIVTNGRMLSNPEFSGMIKRLGVDHLTVSIEGYDSESQDALTQSPGSYNEAIKGIYVASEKGIKVTTNTVISRSSIDSLERIVDSLEDKPIDIFSFNVCGPCLTGEDNSEMVRPELVARSFENIYKYVKSKGKVARLVSPIPLCLFEEGIRRELFGRGLVSGGPCQLSSGRNFVVDYNGDILPCTHFSGFPVGNIFIEGGVVSYGEFIEMYNSPEGIPFKFRRKLNRTASDKCDSPKCEEPCTGGCPLIWKVFNPQEEIPGFSGALK